MADDTLAAISTATAAVRLVGAVLNTAGPHVKNALNRSNSQDADVTGGSTYAPAGGPAVPIAPERETRAYETANYVLRTMGSRILAAGLVNEQALAQALTAATSHIEMRLFSVETNRLFQSLASKLNDVTLVNSVFTCIYFFGFLLAEIKSSLPGYKATYIPLGQRIVQQVFNAAIGDDAFQENHDANLEAYKTLTATAGLLRPTDLNCSIFPDFPTFSPNRYSTKSFSERSYHKNAYQKLVRHFETFGFPQPLVGRDVGPIRDWRFFSSDTNDRSFEVEKADKYIGENFGRVLYYLICSAHRMPAGMAVVVYYDQHLSLVRWFGARFGYRVIRANGDLNLSGNHMNMDKKMRTIFDTWLILMPSESGLQARANAAQAQMLQQSQLRQAQPAAVLPQTAPVTMRAPPGLSETRPHASTMQSTPSPAGAVQPGIPTTLDTGFQHPSRANTLPSNVNHAAAHRLSVSESVGSADATPGPSHTPTGNPGVSRTPSTMSPPLSPVARPVQTSAARNPSRQSSTNMPSQPNAGQRASVSSAGMYAPHHPKTVAMQKLEDVASTYNLTYVPLCNRFLQTQFPSLDALKHEHAVITEGMMTQVILKLDDVDIQGDEVARIRRKGLVDEIQGALAKLDERVRLATEANTTPPQATPQPQEAPGGDPQPGISRVYTNPPVFHSTINPAELAAIVGFAELPASSDYAGSSTARHSVSSGAPSGQAELAATVPLVEAPADLPRKPVARRKAPPRPKKVILAKALDDFEPEDDEAGDELAFKEGDIIEIVEKTKELEEQGWCRARVQGQKKLGLAPLDYLEELLNQQALPVKAPSKPTANPSEDGRESTPSETKPVTAQTPQPNAASQTSMSQAALSTAQPIKPTIEPVPPSNLSSPVDTQTATVQSIQPVTLAQPDVATTPPPPYATVQEHAALVGGGSAAQYYNATEEPEAMSRSAKVSVLTPPGITNPNHNAGTYFATHIFKKPQKKDSTDSTMSPGDQPTMRGMSTAPGHGPAHPLGQVATPSSHPQGQPPGALRPSGESPGPGSLGRPTRPTRPGQLLGPNMAQNIGGFGSVLGGIGQIMSASSGGLGESRPNHHNKSNCGGCGQSHCSGCGSHGDTSNNSTSNTEVNQSTEQNQSTEVNQTINVSNSYQNDVTQQSVVENIAAPVSPVESGYTSVFNPTMSSISDATVGPTALAPPTNVVTTPSSDVYVQPEPTVASSESFTVVSSPSPLAGLSPASDPTVAMSPFPAPDAAVSPLAGLAPATTTVDSSEASFFTTTSTAPDGTISPFADMAVAESSQTTSLGGGVSETTTVAVAVETDVAGYPITSGSGEDVAVGVAVTESTSTTGGSWDFLGGDDSQGYGDSGGGDFDF